MKNWIKILVAVLSLAMVLGLVACGGDEPAETPAESTPVETPAASTPEATNPAETPEDTDPAETPEDTDPAETPEDTEPAETPVETEPAVVDPEIEDSIAGFITGDIVDGKAVATNGGNGTEYWTGTGLEGYAIKSDNADLTGTVAKIELPLNLTEAAIITFNAKVDAPDGDFLYILLNGKKMSVGDLTAGEHTVVAKVAAGENTIAFCFTKGDNAKAGVAYVSKLTVEKDPVAIDGVKDDFYTNATEYAINTPWGSNPASYDLTGGTAWVTNDGTGLYIYAEVQDETLTATGSTIDAGDKFQVYLDIARDSATLGKTGSDYKATGTAGSYRLGWVNATPDGVFGGNWGFSGVTIEGAVVETDYGYAVEMYIPLRASVIPADGVIGVAFAIHDDVDGNDNRDAIFYGEDGSDYWNSYEAIPPYTLVK